MQRLTKDILTTKCFIILRTPTEHENAELRHAGMDGRHPGLQDASGDIHVGLIPALHAGMTESRGSEIFDHNLRALRVLRGDLLFSFGCGFAALGSVPPLHTI
jgi:hypothetical protein